MKYFQKLDYPIFENVLIDLNTLLSNKIIRWSQDQICLNTVPGQDESFEYGVGSLNYDWQKMETIIDQNGQTKIVTPIREKKILESDFKILCKQFKGTAIEDIYNFITSKYKVGRIRIMSLKPKVCLSWHHDDSSRLHYPLVTYPGCCMVIEDEVLHMPANTWWMTNTLEQHTAFNGSRNTRLHLVASILE